MIEDTWFEEDAGKIWSFGNFLVVVPSKETTDVIVYMNE